MVQICLILSYSVRAKQISLEILVVTLNRFQWILSTHENMLLKVQLQYSSAVFFDRVAKNCNILPNSVLIAFNIESFRDQLYCEEVSQVTDMFLRYLCSYLFI